MSPLHDAVNASSAAPRLARRKVSLVPARVVAGSVGSECRRFVFTIYLSVHFTSACGHDPVPERSCENEVGRMRGRLLESTL
jgi:hypothetical protein